MTNIILSSIGLVIMIVLNYQLIKRTEQLKRYRILIDQKDEDIKFLTSEMKDIVSFSKYAIERWEAQVHENKQLNDRITILLKQVLNIKE